MPSNCARLKVPVVNCLTTSFEIALGDNNLSISGGESGFKFILVAKKVALSFCNSNISPGSPP